MVPRWLQSLGLQMMMWGCDFNCDDDCDGDVDGDGDGDCNLLCVMFVLRK